MIHRKTRHHCKLIFSFVFCTLFVLNISNAKAIEPEDKWEGPIDYAATGGSFLEDTCYAGPTGCILGQFDNQGDRVTATSSAGLYGIPEPVNVVKAYLIWMSSVDNDNPAMDNKVILLPPGGDEYEIEATEDNLTESIKDGLDADDQATIFHFYSYKVDITDIIQQHSQNKSLNGSYTVKDFQGYSGEPYLKRQIVQAGWSLFMVYSKSQNQSKRIYFYSYFDQIRDQILKLQPTGFLSPDNAKAKFTLFVGEGDASIQGSGAGTYDESLSFNNYQLTDNCNSEDNVFNGTNNTNLNDGESCRTQIYSVDLDTFDVGQYLTASDTSAEIELSVGQDMIITNYFVLSLSSKVSDFDIPDKPEKAASTPTGGNIANEETFTYYIYVQNNGDEVATNVKVKDQLPSQVEYIQNSTYVVEPDGQRRQITDLSGGFAPSLSGIDIASTMPPGEDYRRIVEISVQVKSEFNGVIKGDTINNTAEIIANRNDVFFTNGGDPVTHTVEKISSEGTLKFSNGKKHAESRFVEAGDKDVVIAQINLSANDDDVAVNSIAFSAVNNSTASFIESAEIYWDLNSNGVLDSEDKILGQSASWISNSILFSDFSLLGSIKENDQQNLILVVNISPNATAGENVQLEILSENVAVKGFTSGLPFQTSILYIPDENTDLSVEPGMENPSDGYVKPGSNINLIQLKLKSYQNPVTINQFSFELAGTLYDSKETEGFVLYKDIDFDGNLTVNDTELANASATTDNDQITFSGLSETIAAASESYYGVVAKLSSNIGLEKTLQLTANSISAGEQVVIGLPVSGGLITVSKDVTNCENDDECEQNLGANWYCNELLSICEETEIDGDTDGITDGDVDGDIDTDFETDENDSTGGGCNETSQNLSFAVILLALVFIIRKRLITAR